MTIKLVETIKESERRADDLIGGPAESTADSPEGGSGVAYAREESAAADKESRELLAQAEAEAKEEAAKLADLHRKEIEEIGKPPRPAAGSG